MFALRRLCLKNTMLPLTPRRHYMDTFHRGVKFFFQKNLLLTNSITSGVFMALGDLAAQELEYQSKVLPERYDWGRLGRMMLVGILLGPPHHYYYMYLDKIWPKANMRNVSLKVLCDQAIAGPATILGFYLGMGVLEQKSYADTKDEIVKKFKYVYAGDCLFWPPVQIFNFYYLPTQYRVIYINLATMVFNIFMSLMKHYDHKTKQHE